MGLHSVPPPPDEPKGPGIRKPRCKLDPVDFAARMRCAEALDALMTSRRISNQEVADAFHVHERIVRDMRRGERPIPVHKLGLLPTERLRVLFHDAFIAAAPRAA